MFLKNVQKKKLLINFIFVFKFASTYIILDYRCVLTLLLNINEFHTFSKCIICINKIHCNY